jgi:hypothetical protein
MTRYPEKEKELHVLQFDANDGYEVDDLTPGWRVCYLENEFQCEFNCTTLKEALSYTQRWMNTKGFTITRVAFNDQNEPVILLPGQDADAIALILSNE